MKEVLQQGQADGLCGLYAILNFLNRTAWQDWTEHGLRTLLDAARHFGWLTPHHLTDGFEDHQLKSILNHQFASYRMDFEAHFLSDVVAAHNDLDFQALLQRIVEKGGAAIVHWETRKHWLLVTCDREGPIVCDSADQKRPRSLLSKRRIAYTEWGVVMLPSERPMLQLDL